MHYFLPLINNLQIVKALAEKTLCIKLVTSPFSLMVVRKRNDFLQRPGSALFFTFTRLFSQLTAQGFVFLKLQVIKKAEG
jgi:hypothetical protein